MFCILHSKKKHLVEIATHPKGYRVHTCKVLWPYATDKNQATPAWYHILVYNFNLDILRSDGSVIGTRIRSWLDLAFRNNIL